MTNEEAIRLLKAMIDEMILVFDRDRKKALNMAIEALKEQSKHSQNTSSKQPDLETLGIKTEKTCEDVISRQAAIDAILAVTGNSSVRELYEHVQEHGLSEMWSGGVNAAIDIIIAVPSAQPETSTEIQEILNYLDTTLHPIVSPDNWYVYAELHDMVSMLPSAQLERETGKWMLDNNNYYEERYICSQCGVNYKVDTCMGKPAWSFCPNCGADMRGESDE